jgi:hypothetical protein
VSGPRRGVATTRTLAAAGGVLAGIGGAVHGIGEVAQGPGAPEGIFFESWTTGRIASNLGGEPGMSLVPDLLLTGLLTLASSTAVAWWAAGHLGHRYGGRVLAALSVLMLLVGGGVGPPTMGLLAALVAGTSNRSLRRTPGWARGRAGRRLAAAWPTFFWLALTDYAFLVFGSLIAGVALDVDISAAFVLGLLLALVLMPLATLTGVGHDATTSARRAAPAAGLGRTP